MIARPILLALALCVPSQLTAQELTYRQKQAVKNMTWTVNQVEKSVLPKYTSMAWLRQKNTWTVPELNKHINAVNYAFKKLNDAVIHLNKAGCTTAQPPVKALVARINAGRKTLRKASAELQVVAKKASAAGNVNNYKDYAKDTERMKKIAQNFQIHDLMAQADAAKDASPQFSQAVRWINERKKFYQPFFQQKTHHAEQLRRATLRAVSVLTRFKATAQTFINQSPKAIDRELTQANKLLTKSVAETKPLFLEGGVKQQLDLAAKRLQIVESLLGKKRPEWLVKARGRHTELLAAKKSAGIKMAASIIAGRRAPQDRYSGPDKEELRARILKDWKAAHPKHKILGVRLPTAGWKRRKQARWVGSAWVFTDTSWIQLRVAVQDDDKLATLYVAYVNKDNQTGTVTTNVGTDNEHHVVQKMLLKNWK